MPVTRAVGENASMVKPPQTRKKYSISAIAVRLLNIDRTFLGSLTSRRRICRIPDAWLARDEAVG